jgi:hypothetical protein
VPYANDLNRNQGQAERMDKLLVFLAALDIAFYIYGGPDMILAFQYAGGMTATPSGVHDSNGQSLD